MDGVVATVLRLEVVVDAVEHSLESALPVFDFVISHRLLAQDNDILISVSFVNTVGVRMPEPVSLGAAGIDFGNEIVSRAEYHRERASQALSGHQGEVRRIL